MSEFTKSVISIFLTNGCFLGNSKTRYISECSKYLISETTHSSKYETFCDFKSTFYQKYI